MCACVPDEKTDFLFTCWKASQLQPRGCIRGLPSPLLHQLLNTFTLDTLYAAIICTSFVFTPARLSPSLPCSHHLFLSAPGRINQPQKAIYTIWWFEQRKSLQTPCLSRKRTDGQRLEEMRMKNINNSLIYVDSIFCQHSATFKLLRFKTSKRCLWPQSCWQVKKKTCYCCIRLSLL